MSELLNFILDHEAAFQSTGRLGSLYSDFRFQKNLNPDGYYANITAWAKALAAGARAGLLPSHGELSNLLIIRTSDELPRALVTKEFGMPSCLGAVFEESVHRKEMLPLSDFLSSTTSIYGRFYNVTAWNVVKWGLQALGVIGQGSGNKLGVANFVVVANVEAAASAILGEIHAREHSRFGLLFSRTSFLREFAHVLHPSTSLTPSDLSVVLTYLARDKDVLAFDDGTIKFKPEHDTSPSPITDEDRTVVQLQDMIHSLNAQLQSLTERINQLNASAREAVASKSLTAAKSALRSKKAAEAAFTHRMNTISQLEENLTKIEQAADNMETMKLLQASTKVLQSLHQQVGGAEGVSAALDAHQEELQRVEEINDLINEVGQQANVIDEGEIDNEFVALEKEEKEKKEAEEAKDTEARLAELRKAEQERVEKEKERAAAQDAQVKEAGESFHKLSFAESPVSEGTKGSATREVEDEKRKAAEPIPAS